MSRRLPMPSLLVAALAAALVAVLWIGRSSGVPGSSGEPAAEVHEAAVPAPEEVDPEALLAQAEGLLATDRPWQAARLLRPYVEARPDLPLAHRLVAARAEAGWGDWERVHGLLEGVPLEGAGSLAELEGGLGLYLLGRARDEVGDAAGAVEAYRAFLAQSEAEGVRGLQHGAARLRLGLALLRAGEREAGERELAAVRAQVGPAAVWIDALAAQALAETGDREAVRRVTAEHTEGALGLRAWRARITAARAAGDAAEARRLAEQAQAWARTNPTRAEFLVAVGDAARALGDDAAARAAYRAAIARTAAGPHAERAAERLLDGEPSAADRLAVARVLRAQGRHAEAVEHFRAWLRRGQGGEGERARVRLELAEALFYAERFEEALEILEPLGGQATARALRARVLAHLDRPAEAAEAYLMLARAGEGADRGAGPLYFAADTWHHAGETARARALYERVVAEHPGTSWAGLALVRLAGMAYQQGDPGRAAALWDRYRQQFPRGPLAVQATYWAARAREAAGRRDEAEALYRQVRQRDRDGYYGLLASRRLGVAFWPIPMGTSPPENGAARARVGRLLRGVDVLREAGFPEEASLEVDRVVARAGTDRDVRYALAEALVERGYSQRAIRIGLGLQSGGRNPRLMRILYPFPYRALIEAEAREHGVDPYVVAALIRQESLFEVGATSHVGARGLMQIMPATGRRLAEDAGLERFEPALLYHPEVNVHLGTRYVARHAARYDGRLPDVFSAYNAGAHRVARWQPYPEYPDAELFVERIPFRETRDYVKILTANLALYRGLYGE